MRNLTKTLAVVSFLLPASAYPLGIGEIKLHSALNQNVDAEIALVLSPGEKASDIKVTLAAPDKFDETGIPWSYFLSKLKFQTLSMDNHQVVIKITSHEALKEPFLDFLLQVSWPKGDLFREFTLLVDPPDDYAQTAVPLTQAAESYGRGQYRRQDYQPPVQRERKSRPRVTANGSGGVYGPVGRNDTLWKIAEGIDKGAGVSSEQLMVALYEANPGAFYKANMNALARGKTLKIPAQEDILKLSQGDAVEEFNRQMQAWKSPASVSRIPASEIAADNAANKQLTLSAPSQDSVSQNAVVPTAAQAVGQQNTGAQGGAADAGISARIAALEKQLATMQELMALKDQQLAALQNQPQATKAPPPAAAPAQVTPPTVTEPVKPAVAQPEPVPGPTETKVPPVTPAVTKVPPAVSTATQPGIPANQPGAAATKPQPPAPPVKPPVHRVTPPPVPVEETSIWEYLGYVALGLGLFGLASWIWLQKRKSAAANPFDVAGVSDRSKSPALYAEADQDSGSGEFAEDNLFVSDFNSGEFDVFDMDQAEIDPISEADVYLAYGRYQQAEELMRHAIDEQPDRDEFKLKLLEIFYAHENKQAFEQYTGQLIDEGKIDNPTFWGKVTEMGSEICPDSIFFAAQANNSVEVKKRPVADEQQVFTDVVDSKSDEMDFDLASFEELFYSDEESNAANPLFDLDADISKTVGAVKLPEEAQANNDDIDFDLDALSFIKPEPQPAVANDSPAAAPSAPVGVKDGLESFDFDFSGPEKAKTPVAKAEPPATPASDDFAELDFDFSSLDMGANSDDSGITFETLQPSRSQNLEESYRTLDFSLDDTFGQEPPKPEPPKQEPPKPALFTDESLSINLDFNKPSLGFSEKQRIESFGVANLSEMDEMETKLDLAMAYIDMGDHEAALEIAMEVLEKGTDEQQMIAKALIENYQ